VKKTLSVLLLLCVLCLPVFAQENGEAVQSEQAQLTEQPQQALNRIYIISSYEFHVDGITWPSIMAHRIDLKTGQEIIGMEALEAYISNKTQLLRNERVLDDVRIEHAIADAGEDGKYPVSLNIYVSDTWNFIIFPEPEFDANSGLDITLKFRDYNFLGTMNPLRIDVGYRYVDPGLHYLSLMLDSDIPFYLFGLKWNFNFDNDFQYRPDDPNNLVPGHQPFFFKNVTGLSFELPIGLTRMNIGFDETFSFNEENSITYWDEDGRFQDGLYMSTYAYISWKIPSNLSIGSFGELIYTPEVAARIYHEMPGSPLDSRRNGPYIYVTHNLGFERFDWITNNLRRGFSAAFKNSIEFNFHDDVTSIYYDLTGIGRFAFFNIFGIYSRLSYRQWAYSYIDNAGDVLRGIYNREVNADQMVSLNLDIPIAIPFRPSQWFRNIGFLNAVTRGRIFDFDIHVVPVFDAAYYNDPLRIKSNDFFKDHFLMSAGCEVIVYSVRWRSLYLRGYLGFKIHGDTESSRPEWGIVINSLFY